MVVVVLICCGGPRIESERACWIRLRSSGVLLHHSFLLYVKLFVSLSFVWLRSPYRPRPPRPPLYPRPVQPLA
jgi:hypothetical protein